MPKIGYKKSEEEKKRLSESHKKIGAPWNIGRRHSDEAKLKMSLAKKGKISPLRGRKLRPLTKEHIEKIRLSHLGKQTTLGKHWKLSEETKKKISIANTGKKMSLESRKKMSLSQMGRKPWNKGKPFLQIRGEKHHNWNGGSSFGEYSIDWTETLRRSIRERDFFTCKICGKIQGDIAHDVHHIDYNKKNCDPKNLVTLCHLCHQYTNKNRNYWTSYFISLIK